MNPQKLFENINNALLKIILSFLLSLVLSYTMFAATALTSNLFIVAILTFLFTFLFNIAFKNNKNTIISGVVAGGVIIILLLLTLFSKSFGEGLSSYYDWLLQYFTGFVGHNPTFINITVIIISFLISLIFYLLFLKFNLYLLTSVFIAGLLFFIENYSSNMPDLAVYLNAAFALVFLILAVYKGIQKRSAGNYRSPSKFTVMIIPFCAAILLVVILLPKSRLPLQIHWLDKIYNQIYESYAVLKSDSTTLFSTAFNIVGGELDGNASPNKIKVISVTTPKPEYLKFSVKDKYTGHSWVDSMRQTYPSTDSRSELYQQQFEMTNGIKYLSHGSLDDNSFFSKITMNITFRQLDINYLFLPQYYSGINTFGLKTSASTNGVVFISQNKTQGYTYDVSTYDIDYGSSLFQNLLRNSYQGFYRDQSSSPQLDILAQRADSIYSEYLQLPANLPDRVKQLAQSVTADQHTDYDKVKAIEDYVSKIGNYTLTPPVRPINDDLVDYFLFDSKQGYCTSYASAMAVMVRSIGLPARYCEGFVMPDNPNSTGTYVVTNENAHAWVEVYFEGFGWVPFEPTKTFTESFYSNAALAAPSDETSSSEIDTSEVQSNANEGNNGQNQDVVGVPSFPDTSSSQKPLQSHPISGEELLIIVAFLVIAFIIAIMIILDHNDKKSRRLFKLARSLPPNDAAKLMFEFYVRNLKLVGLGMSGHETAYEFISRIKGESENLEPLSNIVEAYVLARYSEHEPKIDSIEYMYFYKNEFEKWFKSRSGAFKFFIYHFILGSI